MMNRMFVYLCVLSTFFMLIACAVNPVTGKREFMLVSEADEIAMGQQSDPQIVAQYGVYNDEKLNKYLNDLGQKMAAISHRPSLNYEFKVVDSPIINAFAVPGGYVYFTRGIMAYLNNEAELAGVLGHEIGHITARHSAQQISQAQVAQVGLGIGSVISPTFAQFAGMAGQGIQLLFLKFGRDDERQSDKLGVEYSTKIGYDAREMANFFYTLDRMSGGDEGGGLPSWMSTHPPSEERVVNVRRMAEERQKTLDVNRLKVDRDEYLAMIDGLIFGDDPLQGYVENDVFYHPDLRFQFPTPQGWNTVNTPSKVGMVSPDKKAMMILIATPGTLAEIEQGFVKEFGVTVNSSNSKTVNGLQARVMEGSVPQQDGTVGLLAYFIQHDNLIYVLYGYAYSQDYGNNKQTFLATMNGFSKLTDQSKINVKPNRIRVKTVSRGGTLQDVLKAYRVADDNLELLALVNGMKLTDNVAAGSKIKLIEK